MSAQPVSAPQAKSSQTNVSQIIIAPLCLLENRVVPFATLASNGKIALIAIDQINSLVVAKKQQQKVCGGFMNVTHAWQAYHPKNLSTKNKATVFLKKYTNDKKTILATANNQKSIYVLQYPKQVNHLMNQINPQQMWDNLYQLTAIPNRFAFKWIPNEDGKKTNEWIENQLNILIKNSSRTDVSMYTIPTYYVNTITKQTELAPQSSVILKIGNSLAPGVVVGTHMDDVVWELPILPTIMPGADDDGTGTVTALELARVLLASSMTFKKPIYIIWYAAEELGLLGSQNVVEDFQKKQISVAAVLQLDMTGYAPNNDLTMWLIDDYVDNDLTLYLAKLITTYVKQPVAYTQCGYACSDHATWTSQGYVAVMPYESTFTEENPFIHTKEDTMDKLSLAHMTDYAKLAIAFSVELAEPIAASE